MSSACVRSFYFRMGHTVRPYILLEYMLDRRRWIDALPSWITCSSTYLCGLCPLGDRYTNTTMYVLSMHSLLSIPVAHIQLIVYSGCTWAYKLSTGGVQCILLSYTADSFTFFTFYLLLCISTQANRGLLLILCSVGEHPSWRLRLAYSTLWIRTKHATMGIHSVEIIYACYSMVYCA